MHFPGFSRQALMFLTNLATHNDRAWFAAHKEVYQAALLAPAQQFVAALGERLRMLALEIQGVPMACRHLAVGRAYR